MLELIAPELLFTLLHEQLSLYNAPPPTSTAPPPTSAPSARQERALRTGYGEQEAPPAVAVEDEIDGAVRCVVSRDGPGWRRLCDVCATSVFNLRLAENDGVSRSM